ncbi:uncharacterized protein FOMMEDRAFT_102558 [Fomitiporia mediterranea MF3/22]|uniref:uncharacterized protein n=1 Tax=Fomitiporia mediterranea (strain MF3/22) TaxID=694068 RepID=UPI000440975A|nr:uncharacterized protein FOMMEDRAFT_102558 [Fomitiporia mediterranea MF3/22]EJD06691.1 hypothetical protein FOMMEDRAFT_102558 [Fomitiporia mediterranea MF3/22]
MADEFANNFNEDALFLERLDVFLEKSLDDLQEFARREGRDFEHIRLKAAEWHSRYLFDQARKEPHNDEPNQMARSLVHDVLDRTSRTLESLLTVAGHHSFLLVVDPFAADNTDEGFLGGTTVGREYWRGLRNGGATGARNFKEFCRKSSGSQSGVQAPVLALTSASSKQTPAGTMKNNLYVEMRSRLRAVSGVRNAEMRWTKPEKLSAYGVVLEGWPREIEYKNPSKMSFHETSTIMRLLQENKMYFRSLHEGDATTLLHPPVTTPSADVSWALHDDT